MGARALAPSHVALGVADTEILAELAADETRQIVLVIGNTETAKRTFSLHVYESAAPASETAGQDNAIGGWFNREIGPSGEESLILSMHLTEGWKISGSADVADDVVVHVFPIEL
jgi:hypothetical protein